MTEATRLKALWESSRGTLVMRRIDWDAALGAGSDIMNLDVERTPLADVARDATVVASVAHNFGPANVRVSIYRHDPKDAPTPFNKDEYEVWTDLQQHPKLDAMIAAASTSDNENFRRYCAENVFIVKRKPGNDHWLKELPGPVKAVLKKL